MPNVPFQRHEKLIFKLQRVPIIISEEEKNALEDDVTTLLTGTGLEPLYGQALRGTLECRAQQILELLGQAGSSKESEK